MCTNIDTDRGLFPHLYAFPVYICAHSREYDHPPLSLYTFDLSLLIYGLLYIDRGFVPPLYASLVYLFIYVHVQGRMINPSPSLYTPDLSLLIDGLLHIDRGCVPPAQYKCL